MRTAPRRNYHQQFCLDQQDAENNIGLPVLVFDCTGRKGNQYWYYRADGRLTRDFLCIGQRRPGVDIENDVQLVDCKDGDVWGYEPRTGALQHQDSGKRRVPVFLSWNFSVLDPDSGVFWTLIQGLKKLFKMLNYRKIIIYFLIIKQTKKN